MVILPPVIQQKDAGTAITRLVWTVHDDQVHAAAEAPRHHLPVGFFARGVDTGEQVDHPDGVSERARGIEQRGEMVCRFGSGPDGSKLDIEAAFAGFAGRAPMANGEGGEATARVPDQERISEVACGHGADFSAQIESLEDLVGQDSRLLFGSPGEPRETARSSETRPGAELSHSLEPARP